MPSTKKAATTSLQNAPLIILFWRPWEEVICCEAATIHEHNCEATSLLSIKPVTPPLLVTPPIRSQVEATPKRKMTRNMQRLLDFQVTLEKEKGLPPSRWLTRLGENLARGDATPILGSPRHRRRKRVIGEVEANSQDLRGGSSGVGRGQCQILPTVDSSNGVVIASRPNFPMLHTATEDGSSSQRRAFCWGCGSWGYIIPFM